MADHERELQHPTDEGPWMGLAKAKAKVMEKVRAMNVATVQHQGLAKRLKVEVELWRKGKPG